MPQVALADAPRPLGPGILTFKTRAFDLGITTRLTIQGVPIPNLPDKTIFLQLSSTNLGATDSFSSTIADVGADSIVVNIQRTDRMEDPAAGFFMSVLVAS